MNRNNNNRSNIGNNRHHPYSNGQNQGNMTRRRPRGPHGTVTDGRSSLDTQSSNYQSFNHNNNNTRNIGSNRNGSFSRNRDRRFKQGQNRSLHSVNRNNRNNRNRKNFSSDQSTKSRGNTPSVSYTISEVTPQEESESKEIKAKYLKVEILQKNIRYTKTSTTWNERNYLIRDQGPHWIFSFKAIASFLLQHNPRTDLPTAAWKHINSVSFIDSISFEKPTDPYLISQEIEGLNLTYHAIGIAKTMVHRFYLSNSFTKCPPREIAAAALILTSKVLPIETIEISTLATLIGKQQSKNSFKDTDVDKWVKKISFWEIELSNALSFDFSIQTPVGHLWNLTSILGIKGDLFRRKIGDICNDALSTLLTLRCPPELLACAIIFNFYAYHFESLYHEDLVILAEKRAKAEERKSLANLENPDSTTNNDDEVADNDEHSDDEHDNNDEEDDEDGDDKHSDNDDDQDEINHKSDEDEHEQEESDDENDNKVKVEGENKEANDLDDDAIVGETLNKYKKLRILRQPKIQSTGFYWFEHLGLSGDLLDELSNEIYLVNNETETKNIYDNLISSFTKEQIADNSLEESFDFKLDGAKSENEEENKSLKSVSRYVTGARIDERDHSFLKYVRELRDISSFANPLRSDIFRNELKRLFKVLESYLVLKYDDRNIPIVLGLIPPRAKFRPKDVKSTDSNDFKDSSVPNELRDKITNKRSLYDNDKFSGPDNKKRNIEQNKLGNRYNNNNAGYNNRQNNGYNNNNHNNDNFNRNQSNRYDQDNNKNQQGNQRVFQSRNNNNMNTGFSNQRNQSLGFDNRRNNNDGFRRNNDQNYNNNNNNSQGYNNNGNNNQSYNSSYTASNRYNSNNNNGNNGYNFNNGNNNNNFNNNNRRNNRFTNAFNNNNHNNNFNSSSGNNNFNPNNGSFNNNNNFNNGNNFNNKTTGFNNNTNFSNNNGNASNNAVNNGNNTSLMLSPEVISSLQRLASGNSTQQSGFQLPFGQQQGSSNINNNSGSGQNNEQQNNPYMYYYMPNMYYSPDQYQMYLQQQQQQLQQQFPNTFNQQNNMNNKPRNN